MRPRLVVMAKQPRMGRAKTRLAADIGVVQAQRIARAMMARILRTLRDPRWDLEVRVAPDDWRVPGVVCVGQGGGGLTERLVRAMNVDGPVCVVGTDSPEITAGDIAAAFQHLRRANVVFGPAEDGGFWLIGARGPVRTQMFKGVRWSTEHALEDVAANVDGRIAYLRQLVDVDDLDSLNRSRRAWLASSEGRATHPS